MIAAGCEPRKIMDSASNNLAPLAGRGRKLRVAQRPGEGERLCHPLWLLCGRQIPLTPTLSPQAGRGSIVAQLVRRVPR
jgi:hypothetical protein